MLVNVKLRKEIWAFKTSLGYRVVDYLWKIERKTDRQTEREGRKEGILSTFRNSANSEMC